MNKDKSIRRKRDEMIDFFVENPDFFMQLISEFYPLNENLIGKYKHEWNMNWHAISQNEKIEWSENLIWDTAAQ